MDNFFKLCGYLIVSSLLFFSSTYFVIWTLYAILSIDDVPYLLSGIITIFIAVSLVITKFWASLLTQILYYLVAFWWGILLYTLIFSIVYHCINIFSPLSATSGLVVVILPSFVLLLYGAVNACTLKIEHINVELHGISKNLKIAHISDLHLGPIYNREHTKRVVRAILKEDPDFVAITGDLFDGSMELTVDMVEPFNELPMNIYFVLGNHDAIVSGMDEIQRVLAHTKIILVRNEQIQYKGVNIIGMDYSSQCGYLKRKLPYENLSQDEVNVLLYHVPEIKVDDIATYNVNLHLAGHTHAGQMLPFQINVWLLYPYSRGLFQSKNGKSYVHVSEGTGTAGPPLRMFSQNTISILNLHP